MTLSGTQAQLNAALATLSYASPAANPSALSSVGFLRGPSSPRDAGGEEGVQSLELQVAQPPAGALNSERVFVPAMGLPAVRAQMDMLETKPQRTDLQVEPARMQILPFGEKGLDLSEEDRQRIEVVLNSVRDRFDPVSVRGVWWTGMAPRGPAARAGAGRGRKSGMGRHPQGHRAAWILEEREARS